MFCRGLSCEWSTSNFYIILFEMSLCKLILFVLRATLICLWRSPVWFSEACRGITSRYVWRDARRVLCFCRSGVGFPRRLASPGTLIVIPCMAVPLDYESPVRRHAFSWLPAIISGLSFALSCYVAIASIVTAINQRRAGFPYAFFDRELVRIQVPIVLAIALVCAWLGRRARRASTVAVVVIAGIWVVSLLSLPR
jgi:hypothetical protein